MSIFTQNKEFYDKPYRLNEQQRENPIEVFEDFFSGAVLSVARERLANLLEVALTTNNTQFQESNDRDNILLFCKQAEEVFEAAFILQEKKVANAPA